MPEMLVAGGIPWCKWQKSQGRRFAPESLTILGKQIADVECCRRQTRVAAAFGGVLETGTLEGDGCIPGGYGANEIANEPTHRATPPSTVGLALLGSDQQREA